MLKVMKLEMKKLKVGGYWLTVLVINILIAIGFWFMVIVTPPEEIAASNGGFCEILCPKIDFLIKATFLIYAAVLIARLIIEEYRNNTISVLFMYPINRKKLIIAKLAIVVILTFSSIVLSDIFISGVLYIANLINPILSPRVTLPIVLKNLNDFLMSAIATSGMCLIPLYFGMRKKSVTTTIIAAILIALFMRVRVGDFAVNSVAAISIGLALVGCTIAYMSIHSIERKDVNN